MPRHVIDHRALPGPSRLTQFLRIARRMRPATWHRPEALATRTGQLTAYWRIVRGHTS